MNGHNTEPPADGGWTDGPGPADRRGIGRGEPRRYSSPYLIALVVAIIYFALLVAIYGFIALTLNRSVIAEPRASVFLGPAMVLIVCFVVFASVARGLPISRVSRRLPVARSVMTALVVYLLGPAIGGIVYAIGRNEPFAAIDFFFRYLASPFIAGSVVAAFLVVLLAPFIDRPAPRLPPGSGL